jgi:hypothetical protein
MANPTQYTFEMSEVATALIKAQNIHEGRWWVGFEFTLGSGLLGGPIGSPDAFPGAFFTIRRLVLAQATGEPPPPPHLIVDAAQVNPKTKGKGRS